MDSILSASVLDALATFGKVYVGAVIGFTLLFGAIVLAARAGRR